jgi:hypothetical protein
MPSIEFEGRVLSVPNTLALMANSVMSTQSTQSF